jgi:hypothetical protein
MGFDRRTGVRSGPGRHSTTYRHRLHPAVARTVGLVDLALAWGLFFRRRSWPRLLARAASNPAPAAVALASPAHDARVWSL